MDDDELRDMDELCMLVWWFALFSTRNIVDINI